MQSQYINYSYTYDIIDVTKYNVIYIQCKIKNE